MSPLPLPPFANAFPYLLHTLVSSFLLCAHARIVSSGGACVPKLLFGSLIMGTANHFLFFCFFFPFFLISRNTFSFTPTCLIVKRSARNFGELHESGAIEERVGKVSERGGF
uniref:Uncharacterized protein n=1 Tax=Trypanosoma vivax (strain Y486) TaxID=1055687 RepID=G0TXM7_TRYVY|nr:hypothetical protein TVY486_0700610 [Trypanosoma vivax Y486]